MEKQNEEHENLGKTKIKKKKSVNWDTKRIEEINNIQEKGNDNLKPQDINDKEYLEIEVINEEGQTIKEKVKVERKKSKEFIKKREEKMHDEYKKAKEFQEKMKNEE